MAAVQPVYELWCERKAGADAGGSCSYCQRLPRGGTFIRLVDVAVTSATIATVQRTCNRAVHVAGARLYLSNPVSPGCIFRVSDTAYGFRERTWRTFTAQCGDPFPYVPS